eukprot:3173964-Pyramimonas_sp.AAC.1
MSTSSTRSRRRRHSIETRNAGPPSVGVAARPACPTRPTRAATRGKRAKPRPALLYPRGIRTTLGAGAACPRSGKPVSDDDNLHVRLARASAPQMPTRAGAWCRRS